MAQMYREKLAIQAEQAMKTYGTKVIKNTHVVIKHSLYIALLPIQLKNEIENGITYIDSRLYIIAIYIVCNVK